MNEREVGCRVTIPWGLLLYCQCQVFILGLPVALLITIVCIIDLGRLTSA